MAKAIGVSKAAVSQWENGKGIKTENIYLISKLFNVSVDNILNGHLNSESNEEYINRNYTLENYDFKDEINEDNIDELKEFYSRVKMVKSRFFELLPKWAENSLSSKEMMTFIKIKKYFTTIIILLLNTAQINLDIYQKMMRKNLLKLK